jgi:hypothetical protein
VDGLRILRPILAPNQPHLSWGWRSIAPNHGLRWPASRTPCVGCSRTSGIAWTASSPRMATPSTKRRHMSIGWIASTSSPPRSTRVAQISFYGEYGGASYTDKAQDIVDEYNRYAGMLISAAGGNVHGAHHQAALRLDLCLRPGSGGLYWLPDEQAGGVALRQRGGRVVG